MLTMYLRILIIGLVLVFLFAFISFASNANHPNSAAHGSDIKLNISNDTPLLIKSSVHYKDVFKKYEIIILSNNNHQNSFRKYYNNILSDFKIHMFDNTKNKNIILRTPIEINSEMSAFSTLHFDFKKDHKNQIICEEASRMHMNLLYRFNSFSREEKVIIKPIIKQIQILNNYNIRNKKLNNDGNLEAESKIVDNKKLYIPNINKKENKRIVKTIELKRL